MPGTSNIFTSQDLIEILSLSSNATAIYSGEEIIIQTANDAMIAFWGKDRSVIGKPIEEAVPELKGQPFIDLLRNVIRTGKDYEARDAEAVLRVDGELQTFYFDFVYRAVPGPDGIPAILHTATDVTERHLSNRKVDALNNDLFNVNSELADTNSRLQSTNAELRIANEETENQRRILYDFFMQAPTGICVFGGEDLVYEMINPGYQKIIPNRDVLGKPLFEALPELVGQPIEKILRDVYRTGKSHVIRELLVPVAEFDGGPEVPRYFTFNYMPRFNKKQEVDGMFGFVYEVTDQVIARQQLEKSNDHFRKLADLVPAKISNALPTGEFTFFNRHWLDYAGMGFEDLRDFGYHQMMHPDEVPVFQAGLAEALVSRQPYETEMRFRDLQGEYRWHLNIAAPVYDEQGKIRMWVGSTTDIQKMKNEEQRKVDFVSVLSHELKTPVTSIKGYVQLLLASIPGSPAAGSSPALVPSLQRIDKLVTRLTNLIGEMLDVTRTESGALQLHKTTISLNEVVNEIAEDFRFTHRHHRINMTQAFHCEVNADRDKIGQVLTNLIGNAIKYSPNSQQVDITVYSDDQVNVSVSVRDYGIGIDKKEHAKIFDRFYRADEMERKNFTGFGIGLFIAASIVKNHGGELFLESEKGKGSTFTFTLPVAG